MTRIFAYAACSLLFAVTGLVSIQSPAPATQTSKKSPETISVIDINKASPEEFAKLPGIGPKRARQIVAFREKHGPFRRVEDLLAIRGIGHKKWKAIRPFLRVGQDAKKN